MGKMGHLISKTLKFNFFGGHAYMHLICGRGLVWLGHSPTRCKPSKPAIPGSIPGGRTILASGGMLSYVDTQSVV